MTLEQFQDQATQALLGILTENELLEFKLYLKSAKKEEIAAYRELRAGALTLPFAAEAQTPKASVKEAIFANIDEDKKKRKTAVKTSKLIEMPAFRYAASLVAMFAIGVLFSLSLFSKPNPPVAQQSAELEKLAHLTQVQEIAMCSDVHENRLIPASNVKAGGKLYLNDRAHAAVLHICVLPKIKKTENYTVWCIEKNGNTTAIKTIRGGTEMSEVNFIISNLLELHEDMHFQLTRELSAKPQAPSAAVLLKI